MVKEEKRNINDLKNIFSFFQFQRFALDLFVQGVSVQGVYVRGWGGGGLCPRGICPGGKCPRSECPGGYISGGKCPLGMGVCPRTIMLSMHSGSPGFCPLVHRSGHVLLMP